MVAQWTGRFGKKASTATHNAASQEWVPPGQAWVAFPFDSCGLVGAPRRSAITGCSTAGADMSTAVLLISNCPSTMKPSTRKVVVGNVMACGVRPLSCCGLYRRVELTGGCRLPPWMSASWRLCRHRHPASRWPLPTTHNSNRCNLPTGSRAWGARTTTRLPRNPSRGLSSSNHLPTTIQHPF